MKEVFTITAHDGLGLSCLRYGTAEAKAAIQIIHGAAEHKGRYHELCERLSAEGYAVVISDTRGHGESINERNPLGCVHGGLSALVSDQFLVTTKIREWYADLPVYMIAHSLGSVIARCYLQEHDRELKKLVLSGTPKYVDGVRFGVFLAKLCCLCQGEKHRNRVLLKLAGSDSSDVDWICSDSDVVERYLSDPLCNCSYSNGGLLAMFEADAQLHSTRRFRCRNPELPILSLTGEDDARSTGGEAGLQDSLQSLKRAGYHSIFNISYPGMKHEVFNEKGKNIVIQDLLRFLEGAPDHEARENQYL